MGGLVFYLYQTIDIIFDFGYYTIVFKHYLIGFLLWQT